MTLTPAIKGQLTKAIKAQRTGQASDGIGILYAVRAVFARHMPIEQAKHATRKYLAALAR
jgi:hypothetical protein